MTFFRKIQRYLEMSKDFYNYSKLIFYKNQIHLRKGKYVYSYTFTHYYHSDINFSKYPKNLFAEYRMTRGNNKIESLVIKVTFFCISRLIKKSITELPEQQDIKAELIFNKGGAGWKLFDQKNLKILTIYTKKDFNLVEKNLYTLKEYFKTAVTSIDSKLHTITENWAFVYKAQEIEYKNAIKAVISFMRDLNIFCRSSVIYNPNIIDTSKMISELFKLDDFLEFYNLLTPKNQMLLSCEKYYINVFDFFYDLGYGNFNIQKKNYILFDYDGFQNTTNINIFFRLMIKNTRETNFNFLSYFKEGVFDDYFKNLLQINNITYEPSDKEYYFLMGIILEEYLTLDLNNPSFNHEKAERLMTYFHSI